MVGLLTVPRLPCHIRSHRTKRKLSLSELAQATGIQAADLSRIERGIMLPSDEELAVLERELGKPATTFWPLRTIAGFESNRSRA